jgi:DNA invertase Pin-like site-specific DNA recombinase
MNMIAYFRVSTKEQGDSGLGLEGQRAAVRAHAAAHGGRVMAEYVEVESGRRADRPQLAAALAHARRSKARLVVAKLDRLSRNVAFLSALMESKVDFVCCDNPHATKLTIHILAAVAEHEAEAISQRTRAAMQAYKARGGKLGSARPGHWAGREHLRRAGIAKGRQRAAIVLRRQADEAYCDLYPVVTRLRDEGVTLAAIAEQLNEAGHTSRRKQRPWGAMGVRRLLERFERIKSEKEKAACV